MNKSSQNRTQRNVLITGGSKGIGYAIANKLAAEGNNVFICGRNAENMDSAIKKLKKAFAKTLISGCICDVSDITTVKKMVDAASQALGGLDVLINNAGIGFITCFDNMTPNQWNNIINTNLTGVFNCCHAALPWLKRASNADIINIGSRAGRYAFAGGTGYNTTKFGLKGFSEALYLDLQKFGIRVSLIAPGTVATGLTDAPNESWHLLPNDVANVTNDILNSRLGATINMVEIRPVRTSNGLE